jgi:hypothetical protein
MMHQLGHMENVVVGKDMKNVGRNCLLRLKASVAVVCWLSFQSCAFRRHDEKAASKIKEIS